MERDGEGGHSEVNGVNKNKKGGSERKSESEDFDDANVTTADDGDEGERNVHSRLDQGFFGEEVTQLISYDLESSRVW